MPSLSAQERETHISFNDEDEFAIVTTHQRTVITKLRNNGAAEEVGTDAYQGVQFKIPKKLISFRSVRKASSGGSSWTPERRRAAADRMAKARASKAAQ